MSVLRYVKTLEQVKQARENDPEFLESRIRSIRAEYETDPAIYRALVPRPLEAGPRPLVCVTFTDITMQLSPEHSMTIGAAVFGVRAAYDGREGISLITMPMTTEQAVVPGRETFGEPKKLAQIEFERDGDRVACRVSRMGMTYLSASGRMGSSLGPRRFSELGYCFKMFPSCEPDKAFDSDPLLVELRWEHDQQKACALEDATLELGASPLDPVADVPLRRLTRCEYEEGRTQSNGRVLRAVPAEWVLPILHQRYDDVSGQGIEVGDDA